MATDEERLLVRIEAQIRQFEKAMGQVTSGADRAARRVETRFKSMESTLSRVGIGLGRSLLAPLAGFATAREIGQAVDAYTRIQNSLKVAGLQGDELTGVFNRLFESAQKNAAPVESLVELYSRASLVQKELGVSTEELLNFTNGVAAALRVSGKSASESSGALLQLAQALGSGTVRAEEFNSILEGALPIAQAAARGLEEAGGSVAKLRQLVIDGKVSSEAFFKAFEAGQGSLEQLAATTDVTLGGALTKLDNSFIKLVGTFDDTTHASDALIGAMNGIAGAMDRLPGLVQAFRDELEKLNSSSAFLDFLIVTNREAEDFTKRLHDMQSAANAVGKAADAGDPIETRIAQAADEASRLNDNLELTAALKKKALESGGDLIAGPANTPIKTVSLKDFAPPTSKATAARPAGGSGSSPEKDFAREIERIRERTAAINAETASVGKSTFESEKARAAQELLNQAKRAGLEITPKVRAEIDAEAEAYANAAASLERTQDRFSAINDIAEQFGEGFIDSIEGLADGTTKLNDILADTAKAIRRAALEALLLGKGPLAQLLGLGGVGGGVGGLFGKILGVFTGGGATTAALGAGTATASSISTSTLSSSSQAAQPVVQLQVVPGQMFVPVVTSIAGNVAVKHSQSAEQRAIARGPAIARDQQRRYAVA